ncbi:MAG: hypothetical protein ACTS6J_19390 [Burkholderiales bacterium]
MTLEVAFALIYQRSQQAASAVERAGISKNGFVHSPSRQRRLFQSMAAEPASGAMYAPPPGYGSPIRLPGRTDALSAACFIGNEQHAANENNNSCYYDPKHQRFSSSEMRRYAAWLTPMIAPVVKSQQPEPI